MPGLASAKSWNPSDAVHIARRCAGAAIVGLPRWRFQDEMGSAVLLPTEFNHCEGALAHTLGLRPALAPAAIPVRPGILITACILAIRAMPT